MTVFLDYIGEGKFWIKPCLPSAVCSGKLLFYGEGIERYGALDTFSLANYNHERLRLWEETGCSMKPSRFLRSFLF